MRESERTDYTPRPEALLRNKRLLPALSAYALLALLAYWTLEDPFRLVVWVFCAALAALTLARARYEER